MMQGEEMFCGQCGQKLIAHAKFCGHCGSKAEIQSEVQNEVSGNLSQTIKKEISSLPIITLIGDTVKGASGLALLQEQIKEDTDNPILWLFYYEAFITYTKMNKGMNVARVVYNPLGFAVSKGIATGLNALDDEYEKFNPTKCLIMSLAISMKRVEKGLAKPSDLLVAGKTLYYMGINSNDPTQRDSYLLRAIKYITLAIQAEKNHNFIAEYFFYLSQAYGMSGNVKLQYRALNISRKMGFMPSLELMKKLLKDKGMKDDQLNAMVLYEPPARLNDFEFTFKPDAGSRIENSLKFAFNEQSKKIKSTSTRIKSFFS
jgi:hypothetical protein